MEIAFFRKRKEFWNTFLLALTYAIVFYGVQLFFFKSSLVANMPDENNYGWDVGWYRSVVLNGYLYLKDDASNIAFFILFPLIWKITHLSTFGISLLNIVFFSAGFSILCGFFKINVQQKILWLTIPTVYFAFIPYSEALFFLLSATTLYGIKKKSLWIIWVSLFLLSLTRATGVFLAPSLLAMSLLSSPRQIWYKSLFNYLKLYLLPIVLGTAVFVWYQYLCTGIWFVFLEVEEKYWGHKFSWPVLPFNTFAGPSTKWISALAIFTGFFALIYMIVMGIRWLFRNRVQEPLLVVSCGYLLMALLEIILYSPTWGSDTTNLPGIFRYTFMNPFFYVFLHYFTNSVQYTWKNYLLVFLLANIVWLSFGSYLHILYFLYFMGNTILIFLFMLLSNRKLDWPVIVLVMLNFYFQVHMYQMFISNTGYPD